MDAAVYVKMLHDVDFLNLRKMQYKYTKQQVSEMVMLLRQTEFKGDKHKGKNFLGQPGKEVW